MCRARRGASPPSPSSRAHRRSARFSCSRKPLQLGIAPTCRARYSRVRKCSNERFDRLPLLGSVPATSAAVSSTSKSCRSSMRPFLKPLSRKRAPIVSGCVSRRSIARRRAVGDVLVEVIADDLGRERCTVEIEADAGCAARSVIGDRRVATIYSRAGGAWRVRRWRFPARSGSSAKNGRPWSSVSS